MGRKFKVWLDSGANIKSCFTQEVDLEDDLGISSEGWDEMPEAEREEVMKDVAFCQMDWGFKEVTDE